MDDLLREAFGRFTDHIVAVFDATLSTPADPGQAAEAVADLVHALSTGPLAREPHGRALTLEAIARITAPALYHAHREPSGVDGRAGRSS